MNLLLQKGVRRPKVVYVAGPFRGKDSYAIHLNVCRAEALSWRLWEKLAAWRKGSAVLCPHLNTANFQFSLPDHVWLDGDLTLIDRCDAVVLVEGWEKSQGTAAEIKYAKDRYIPVLLESELDAWMVMCDATDVALNS